MSELLTFKSDGVYTITINREDKKNSLNRNVLVNILEALDIAENDQDTRVLCITGAGQKAFCAGADIGGLNAPGDMKSEQKLYVDILKKLNTFKKATVAKVNGVCMGGGLGLALSCDLVLAHEKIVFATPEVNIGLFPLIISPLIYKSIVSEKKSNEMILTGRLIQGDEAFDLGLVSRLFLFDIFESKSEEFLKLLSSKSSQVIGFGKERARRAKGMDFNSSLDFLSESLMELMTLEDAKEGLRAFVEKRSAVFKY